MQMSFSELNTTLDVLLNAANLPGAVRHHGKEIQYRKYSRMRLLLIALYRLLAAQMFYQKQILTRLGSFKKAGFLKTFKPYFYIFRIGLPDLVHCMGGRFDNAIAANYMIAAMFYDAACDVPEYRRYLPVFNDFIMEGTPITSDDDEYLRVFAQAMDYLRSAVDAETFETFMSYIRIEHITQLMSISQASETSLTKDLLFKITLAKGGITIMAGTYLMAPHMSLEGRVAIYELGGVLQILEDVHDINEDLGMGIKTLSNQQLIGYDELRELYIGTINNAIIHCHLDPDVPNATLDLFCWLIGKVLEKKYKPLFPTR